MQESFRHPVTQRLKRNVKHVLFGVRVVAHRWHTVALHGSSLSSVTHGGFCGLAHVPHHLQWQEQQTIRKHTLSQNPHTYLLGC